MGDDHHSQRGKGTDRMNDTASHVPTAAEPPPGTTPDGNVGDETVAYEQHAPNAYEWTKRVYEALTAGNMTANIDGATGSRRLRIEGPCPRCSHEVQFSQLIDAVAGEDGGLKTLGRAVTAEQERHLEVVASCRCTEQHAERPDDVTEGCGINFRVDLEEGQ